MSVPIVPRKEWGATEWRTSVLRVPITEKDNFLVHYHGGKPSAQRGPWVPRNVEAIHLANGWSGVGYNFLVDMDGVVYEGRGWDGVGAQCPGYNRSGIGVYVAVGGDQKPTAAALKTVRALYDELVQRRKGASVRKMGHRDGVATACPGNILYAWVKEGFPVAGTYKPPVVAPAPAPAPPAALAPLAIDGRLGPKTIKRWQKVMGTAEDGVISKPSSLVRKVQERLNTKGARLAVDGLGIQTNSNNTYGPTNTVKALQKYLGTTADGKLSHPESSAVKALQKKLNTGKF